MAKYVWMQGGGRGGGKNRAGEEVGRRGLLPCSLLCPTTLPCSLTVLSYPAPLRLSPQTRLIEVEFPATSLFGVQGEQQVAARSESIAHRLTC